MKIKKFRIKNYKSIVDSGDCYVEQDLTIFAGKNESGKTSVLEALENFNTDIDIPENAKPIGKKDALPEIALTLTLTAAEINKYFEGAKIEKKNTKEQEIEVTKQFPDTYTVDDTTAKLFELEEDSPNIANQELENKIKTVYQEINKVHAQYLARHGWGIFALNLQDIPNLTKHVNAYLQNYRNSYINQIPNQNIRTTHQGKIQELQRLLPEYQNIRNSGSNHWDIFFEILPNFILFRSFENIIPNEVPFAELEKNEFIKDLQIISNIDIPLIKSHDKRGQLQHHKDINIRFNKEYSKFWLQDLTEIKIHWNNSILEFWIEEDNTLFKPSERSKGKQWHMSFYIKITARALEKKANIILVDEPGLYLHPTAQNDIYKELIDRSQKSQILYTTHSPYLLNRDELHRVRLVLKGPSIKDGTLIENKIHARADKETLTPILTAIGLGLSDGIQNINQEKNIVIEGPADYFYLQGLKLLLKDNSFNFIFGGGSGNMGNVGTILSGWGCKVIYLYDNDQGLKDGSKNLSRVWLVKKELIHSIKEDAGRIEDIFSKTDFQKQILRDSKAKIETTNSDFIKKNDFDKVLLARQFNSLCHTDEVKLSEDTLRHCKDLFERLGRAFKNLNGQTMDDKSPAANKGLAKMAVAVEKGNEKQ